MSTTIVTTPSARIERPRIMQAIARASGLNVKQARGSLPVADFAQQVLLQISRSSARARRAAQAD